MAWMTTACSQPDCSGEGCAAVDDGTTTTPLETTSTGLESDGDAGSSESVPDGTSGTSSSGETTSDATTTADDTTSTDDTGGGRLWCLDSDGDGWGDPRACRLSPVPIAMHVPNDGDCDDGAADTHPGAAAEEPSLCVRDTDQDGWGDDTPPPGVDIGTDCDDGHPLTFPGAAEQEPTLCARDGDDDGWGASDPPDGVDPGGDCDDSDDTAFPGAAELEADPTQCLRDADDDGWGDARPGGEVPSGSDCYDANADLSPDTMLMTALLTASGEPGMPRTLATVDLSNGLLSSVLAIEDPVGTTPTVNLVSATIDEGGQIIANDVVDARLHELEYSTSCAMGLATLTPINAPYGLPGYVACGIEWGPGGVLYGVDHDDDLLTFDPVSGQITGSTPISLDGVGLNIESCGMAHDCVNDRLLVMNGIDGRLYGLDTTGTAELLLDISDDSVAFTPTGLEYDPVSRGVYISTGQELVFGAIDGTGLYAHVGFFSEPVSNLQYLPTCN